MDEDIQSELEDGEISDEDVGDYTPLERPIISSQPVASHEIKAIPESSSESEENDSDEGQPAVKIPKPPVNSTVNQNPHNKFRIWCQSVEDEALAENLGGCCDVDDGKGDRNVENYNYRLKFQNTNLGVKRKLDGRNDAFPLERRNSKKHLPEERIILELKHSEESSEEELADDIANKLLEVQSDLILRTVQLAGKKEAIHFFEKTREIEKNGGMWLESQNRRRTPGGIFFFLVKNDRHLPQGVIKTIFDDPTRRAQDKQRKQQKKKRKKMERSQTNRELKEKLQDELNIISANVQNSKSSEGDSNPPPSPVSDIDEEEKMESD